MTAERKSAKWRGAIAAGAIVLAAWAAYANSLSGPFVFDDLGAIQENPTLRHLSPLGWAFHLPHGSTVTGRPILNLSFAINYAFGGLNVWGYHVSNLAIHILASLVLFGITRRTLGRFYDEADALLLAFVVALLWTIHPLQTESVAYIVQRAESLMGLFYLLTLYYFIRGMEAQSAKTFLWLGLSWIACLFGMATKEVMVSAPVMVLLYDRSFIAGSFREAWRKRRIFYLCLAGTWLPLAALVAATGNRGGTVGFGTGVSPGNYWMTQAPAVMNYLGLSLWPRPLVFYHSFDMRWAQHPRGVIPYALGVILILAGTAYALFGPAGRGPTKRALGFAGAWFFAILAPTSVMPGTLQTMAEHRMYLALAPVIAVTVLGIHRVWRRLRPDGSTLRNSTAAERGAVAAVACALAIALGFATARRNEDYRSALALWSDTVAKAPDNASAHDNLGDALRDAGRLPEAIDEYVWALRLKPDFAEAHVNLGTALVSANRVSEAIGHFEEAVRLKPDFAVAHDDLGVELARTGRSKEGILHLEKAVQLQPDLALSQNNLAVELARSGRVEEAIIHYDEAIRLKPDYAGAHSNLGVALAAEGRVPEAITQFEEALRLKPNYAAAECNLGRALVQSGRPSEAIAHFRNAVRLQPNFPQARAALERLLLAPAVVGPQN